jgi:toxin ParE1/3/4
VKPVIFHPDAEGEVRAAIAFYEEKREGLGEEFSDAVQQAIDQIARIPHAFSPYGDAGLRRYNLRRFPYSIYYLELADVIWIAAIAHQRRRPGYWEKRTPD